MRNLVAIRLILALTAIFIGSLWWSCAPKFDAREVRARLAEQLQLPWDRLEVRPAGTGGQLTKEQGNWTMTADVTYGGGTVPVRFRYQDGIWVIDAIGLAGSRWEPAQSSLPALRRQLVERADARWVQESMPRYARTLKLLVGWSELLSTDCSAPLPTSQRALVELHAIWHRTLFPNRGGEFHSGDLFFRDAWWKPFRLDLTTTRAAIRSSGADGRMDTQDDLQMVLSRRAVSRDVTVCGPRYTMPSFVADLMMRGDAPQDWNCADLLSALRNGELLELVQASR